MSYNPDDRISRKDAAALARKSEDTIRRVEKRHNLTTDIDPETNQVTYRVGDLVDLDLVKITDVAIAGTVRESVEVIQARAVISDLQGLVKEKDGLLANVDLLVAKLSEQVSVKDQQIAGFQKQVERLTALLAGGAR